MNCQEALSLLYDYIDKETSEIDARQLEEHLQRCGHCLEHYKLETDVNELLKARVISCCNTSPKIEDLKSRILEKLDEIDKKKPSDFGSNSTRLFSFGLVAAASLVVLIGAAFFGSGFVRHQAEYYPIEDAHFAVVDQDETTVQLASSQGLATEVHDALHYDLVPQIEEYILEAGFVDTVMNVPASHFVYRNNGSKVSVFVFPADQFQIPSDLQESRVVKGGIELFDHNCRGCRLVFHRAGDAVIVTATSDKDVDLLSFIPGHAAI